MLGKKPEELRPILTLALGLLLEAELVELMPPPVKLVVRGTGGAVA